MDNREERSLIRLVLRLTEATVLAPNKRGIVSKRQLLKDYIRMQEYLKVLKESDDE